MKTSKSIWYRGREYRQVPVSGKLIYVPKSGDEVIVLRSLKVSRKFGGYGQVTAWVSGRKKSLLLHRMVIEAWSRQGCVNEQVRHLDGNPSNNHVSNLKWGSVAENSEDTLRHERNRRAKLKSAQVLAIRRRASDGNGMELSRAYGVNISTILAVVRGKTWRHLPDARPDFAFFKGK